MLTEQRRQTLTSLSSTCTTPYVNSAETLICQIISPPQYPALFLLGRQLFHFRAAEDLWVWGDFHLRILLFFIAHLMRFKRGPCAPLAVLFVTTFAGSKDQNETQVFVYWKV